MGKTKSVKDNNGTQHDSDHFFRERQKAAIRTLEAEINILSQMAIGEENRSDLEKVLGELQSIVNKNRASGLFGVEQKVVFHDKIDNHFTELELTDYKKLQNLHLKKLSKINLIAGINNSGKTTLLEAIYLLSRQNDFDGLLELVRRRGKISEEQVDVEWFIEQLPKEMSIQGVFNNQATSVAIRKFKEENSGMDIRLYLETVEIASDFGGIKQQSTTRLYKGKKRETFGSGVKLLCPTVHSSPFFLNEPHRYVPYYYRSMQSKVLPKIFEFINKHFVPSVSDIRLVDRLQRFLVYDQDFFLAPDLTEYGEGLQRVFFISLLFAAAQNGVVLIDEFENAIHTELLAGFTRFIIDLAKEFNVQLFLTSHSKECIDAFVRGIPKENVNDFTAIALVESENKIIAKEFNGEKFRRLVEVGNVDLRRAH